MATMESPTNLSLRARVWLLGREPSRASRRGVFAGAPLEVRRFEQAEPLFEALVEDAPDVVVIAVEAIDTATSETLRALRRCPEGEDLPVIVLSEGASDSAAASVFEAGADDLMCRPLRTQELIARVGRHVGRSRKTRAQRLRGADLEALSALSARLLTDVSAREPIHPISSTCEFLGARLRLRACRGFAVDAITGELVDRGGPPGTEPKASRLSLSPSVLASLASGDVVLLDEPRAERVEDGSWPSLEDAEEASAMLVPVMGHERMLGVLFALHGRAGGESRRLREALVRAAGLASTAMSAGGQPGKDRSTGVAVKWGASQLDHTRDFLINVIESSPDAIVAARGDGAIVLFNRAAENILGWTKAEALGMSVEKLYPTGGAQQIMVMLRSLEFGGPGKLEHRREVVVDRDGREIPVAISAAVVYEEGDEAATVGIFTDLRPQIEMKERLDAANQSLERTRRRAMLAELAGAAAHELNQPLTSLLGYAELLVSRLPEREDGPEGRAARIILREGQRVADIVRRIGKINDYRTTDYVAGARIVDIDQAAFDPEVDLDTRVLLDEPEQAEEPDGENQRWNNENETK